VTNGSGIGEFVRNARKRLGLTQEDLSDRTGLSIGYLGNLERGVVDLPRRPTLEKLSAALDVSINDFVVASGVSDPPTERDVESEMRRIAALPTVEERMDELKRLSPAVYDLVEAWAMDLVRQAGKRQTGETQRRQRGAQPDHPTRPTNDDQEH
jgi:transcriptional regulator with XRE-family HTH domain